MIRILASRKEKGTLFELLLKSVLSRQGYGIIRTKIHQTGGEIDVKAKDNLSGKQITVEAKAHEKPIDTPELKKFLQTASTDKAKKRIDHAIFWSLSGINDTARNYYEDDVESRLKRITTINDDKEFEKFLIDLGSIGSENSINVRIKDIVKHKLLSRELVYYKNNWYFIQYCSYNEKESHFFILNAFGGIVEDHVSKEIRKKITKLKRLKIILFQLKTSVIKSLLNVASASAQEIKKKLNEKI